MQQIKYLVTGGCGFVGSTFINMLLERNLSDTHTHSKIINLDKLTYAANLSNISQDLLEKQPNNYLFINNDICDTDLIYRVLEKNKIDILVNFAAESHVEKSIDDPDLFITSNYIGVQKLLNACVKYIKQGKRLLFHQISTDEVYGQLQLEDKKKSNETDQLHPRSPYSASKSGADLLIESYGITYGLEYVITRSSNNFGPNQHEEKLIPKCIKAYLTDQPITIYGDGMNVRDWISAENHSQLLFMIHKIWFSRQSNQKMQTIFNISLQHERTNISLVNQIQLYLNKKLGLSKDLVKFVEERSGNYRKYSLDTTKLEQFLTDHGVQSDILSVMGRDFEQQLYKCIDMYVK